MAAIAVGQVAGSQWAPSVGEEVMPRFGVTSANTTSGSGTLALTYFTAQRSESISQVRTSTQATAAGATPTICRFGVYSIDAAGAGTLIASTANDTTLFAAAFTVYTRSFSSAFVKQAGQLYALGILVLSAAALPNFYSAAVTPQMPNFGTGLAPRLSARLTGQTDLPGSFAAGSLADNVAPLYSLLLP